jgi:copper chaperone
MDTLQFKTNLKCSGCIDKVTPALNEVAGEGCWKVNLESPDKVLTVSAGKEFSAAIKRALEKTGYRAEELV